MFLHRPKAAPRSQHRCKIRERCLDSSTNDDATHHAVPLTEVLANLAEAATSLFRLAESGELAALLLQHPRGQRAESARARRLSPSEVDQLVVDYRSTRSIRALADRHDVHRNTVASHLKSRGVVVGHQSLNVGESARARELFGEGLSLNAIGRELTSQTSFRGASTSGYDRAASTHD